MISSIRGSVLAADGDSIVIETGGLGLLVQIPEALIKPFPVVEEQIFLYTHLQIKEDGWQLYGFPALDQLEVFRLLLGVSGIGGKTALAIVNCISISAIVAAIKSKDTALFCTVSGVGKKTAERLILELKDKFAKWESAFGDSVVPVKTTFNSDAVEALVQLGYSGTEARVLISNAMDVLDADASISKIINEALRRA